MPCLTGFAQNANFSPGERRWSALDAVKVYEVRSNCSPQQMSSRLAKGKERNLIVPLRDPHLAVGAPKGGHLPFSHFSKYGFATSLEPAAYE